MGRVFINCNDAEVLSTREQYNDLNSKERFKLKMHHSHCWRCRSFNKKNCKFTRTLNGLNWIKLTAAEKAKIRSRIKDAIERKF